MLCPNCKTELIDVNGRYICSDCGKEVPENEVMTSDWGNAAPAVTGLYGASSSVNTLEDAGNMPVSTFGESQTDGDKSQSVQTVEEVLQAQADNAQEIATATVVPELQTVESALQGQADKTPTEVSMAVPAPDIGFYAAVSSPELVKPLASVEGLMPTPMVSTSVVAESSVQQVPVVEQPVIAEGIGSPTPVPTFTEERDTSKIAVVPEALPAPLEQAEESPRQAEVVKDMFEGVSSGPIDDPGLYATADNAALGVANEAAPASNSAPQLSGEKKVNLLILTIGGLLALALIGGGTWAYIALSAKDKLIIAPVVEVPSVSWQELQVVDAGVKISFPGQPEKTEDVQVLSGVDTNVISQTYTSDDLIYTMAYAKATATAETLPSFVKNTANLRGLDILTTKVGKYYDADAIDYTLGLGGSQTYQGKIMIRNGTYIFVEAGSLAGKTTEFDKFIKSFAFIQAVTGESVN